MSFIYNQGGSLVKWFRDTFAAAERRQAEEQLLVYQGQLRSLASELTLVEEREKRQIATDSVITVPSSEIRWA